MAQTAIASPPTALLRERRTEPGASLWGDAFRRLRRSRPAFAAGLLILALALLAIVHPLIGQYRYDAQNYDAITQPPSREHLLGTDQLGRDILSRLIFGARISLTVGIVVQLVILLIGVPAGLIAGYYGGTVDMLLMRTVDVLYSLPSLLFVIVLMTFVRARLQAAEGGFGAVLGAMDNRTGGLIGVFIGLGVISWLTVARLVRAQTLALKEKEFVEAARGLGAGDRRGDAPPHPAEHGRHDRRHRHPRHPAGHPLRGRHQLPRPRRQPAHAQLGPDDQRGDPQPARLPPHARRAGAGPLADRPRLQLPRRRPARRPRPLDEAVISMSAHRRVARPRTRSRPPLPSRRGRPNEPDRADRHAAAGRQAPLPRLRRPGRGGSPWWRAYASTDRKSRRGHRPRASAGGPRRRPS